MARAPKEPCMLVPGPLRGVTSSPISSHSRDLAYTMSTPQYIKRSGPLDLHAYWCQEFECCGIPMHYSISAFQVGFYSP